MKHGLRGARRSVVAIIVVALLAPAATASSAPDQRQPALTGTEAWATLLCRFADSTGTTPHPRERYEAMMGSTYPGMDHYWREASFGQFGITSQVAGWYNLPDPLSAYFDASGNFDRWHFGRDCVAAADPDVFFPSFDGINYIVNIDQPAGVPFGGTALPAEYALDGGPSKHYSGTFGWNPNMCTVAHEMGHMFIMAHSSGPYGAVYDSDWDVMSGGCSAFGSEGIPTHPIAWSKERPGWLPAERTFRYAGSGSNSIVLHPSAGSMPSSGYLWAVVPVPGSSTRYYTVEAKRRIGYDSSVPSDGVLIHEIDMARTGASLALVVDPDRNNDPNDAGAIWTVGETFTDRAAGVQVVVDREGTNGEFTVTIGPAASTRTLTVARAGSGGGTVTSDPPGISCGTDCSEPYAPGTPVTLSALPTSGSSFTGWSGACTGTGPCQVSLSEDRVVTATFGATSTTGETRELAVSITGTGSGIVTSSPEGIYCPGTCSSSFPRHTSVLLSVSSDQGSRFAGWTGACMSLSDCRVVLDTDKAVGANFTTQSSEEVVTRGVTLQLRRHLRAIVQVSIDPGSEAACAEGVPVSIERLRAGTWQVVRSAITSGSQRISTLLPDKRGLYRARLPEEIVGNTTCVESLSTSIRHRH
ncbi:MAG TPA: hypothetical protein VNC78_00860 [Actinomycetota bacterium]|nr:hypothetical protein [Actinomycetota bacterium]